MATITGIVEASSLLPVSVTTGTELRPSTSAKVLWMGGSTKPVNMEEGDIWFRVPPSGTTLPNILTSTLNTMTQGSPFSQALSVDGTPPFTFSVAAGSLPAGLSLNTTTGLISGTPSASGSYSFTIQAANAAGNDSQAYSGTVTSSPVAPTVTTTTLNSLTQGTAFSQTLAATGTAPIAWTISAGTLPAGLSLNSSTGTISGTPTGTGAYSFTVQATNTAGNDTQAYSGTISASGVAPAITTTVLDTLQEGFSFSQTLARTGSTPMTWGISAGTLPAGLTINSSTGVISGTPTVNGAYDFTVQVTNSFGSDTQQFTGSIDPPADADVFSIFGASVPATLTSHTDAVSGDWLSHQFYCSGTALPAGSKIVGARVYVPAGSAHIGQGWFGAVIRNLTGHYPDTGAFPVADYNTNGSKKAGSTLVEGWNEVFFDTEYDVPDSPGSWMIGVQIGDGSRYLHNSTLGTAAIQNPESENFYLAEFSSATTERSWYNATETSARWYGIDTLVSIPA